MVDGYVGRVGFSGTTSIMFGLLGWPLERSESGHYGREACIYLKEFYVSESEC